MEMIFGCSLREFVQEKLLTLRIFQKVFSIFMLDITRLLTSMLKPNPRQRYTLIQVIEDPWVNEGYANHPIDYKENPDRKVEPVITKEWVRECLQYKVCDAGRFMMDELKNRIPKEVDLPEKSSDNFEIEDNSSIEADTATVEAQKEVDENKEKTDVRLKLKGMKYGFGKIVRDFTRLVIEKITGNRIKLHQETLSKTNEKYHTKSTKLHNRKVATASAFETEDNVLPTKVEESINNPDNHIRNYTSDFVASKYKQVKIPQEAALKNAYHSRGGRNYFLRYLGRS